MEKQQQSSGFVGRVGLGEEKYTHTERRKKKVMKSWAEKKKKSETPLPTLLGLTQI